MGLGLGLSTASSSYKSFTLADVYSLALWLKNDTGIQESTGTVVSWSDSSGNSNDAVQGNIDFRAVKYDGGLDFEETEADHYDLDNTITIGENEGFCFAIVLNQETDTSNTILSKEANDVIQISNSEIKIITNAGGSATTSAVFDNNPFAASSGKMLVLVNRTAGQSNVFTFFKNGVQITPNTTGSALEATGENPYGFDLNLIGARQNVGSYFDGVIYELAFWNKSLTDVEIADVNGYLKEIHGL